MIRKLAVAVWAITCFGCRTDIKEIIVYLPADSYDLNIPDHFPEPDLYSSTNPLSTKGVALGRKLFYDPMLSGNNQIACASCHQQTKGFADGLSLTNIGNSGNTLLRHAPALINMAWMNGGLFWDGGSTNLESQAFSPLESHDEMYQNLYELEDELAADPEYPSLFEEAFGELSMANMVKALAQFQRTLVSATSPYDAYVQGTATLTSQQLKGLKLVENKCQSCHSGVLFTDNAFHNNGLDDDFTDNTEDGIYQGRFRVSRDSIDMGHFKTPTLRNVMVSAPYMHDGRFADIYEVLDHYTGVKISKYTSAEVLTNETATGIALTEEEKDQIIAFLQALTDENFITSTELSQPE